MNRRCRSNNSRLEIELGSIKSPPGPRKTNALVPSVPIMLESGRSRERFSTMVPWNAHPLRRRGMATKVRMERICGMGWRC